MNSVIELNESNFDREVLHVRTLVIVDFWAEDCAPCRMMAPILDQIAADYAERIKIAKVEVNAQRTLASRYQIQSMPTLLFFLNGVVRQKIVGAVSKKIILNAIEGLESNAP